MLLFCYLMKNGDLNPQSRARNSRLGEFQGWPLNHSHFLFISRSLPLSLSSNNPGKFYDIQSLARNFHTYISNTQKFLNSNITSIKVSAIHLISRYTCVQSCFGLQNILVSTSKYKSRSTSHALRTLERMLKSLNCWTCTLTLPQTSKWIDGGKMLGGNMCLPETTVPLPSEKLCPLTRLVCVHIVHLCCVATWGAHTQPPLPPLWTLIHHGHESLRTDCHPALSQR